MCKAPQEFYDDGMAEEKKEEILEEKTEEIEEVIEDNITELLEELDEIDEESVGRSTIRMLWTF